MQRHSDAEWDLVKDDLLAAGISRAEFDRQTNPDGWYMGGPGAKNCDVDVYWLPRGEPRRHKDDLIYGCDPERNDADDRELLRISRAMPVAEDAAAIDGFDRIQARQRRERVAAALFVGGVIIFGLIMLGFWLSGVTGV